jgi:dTMP kinase
MTCWQEHYKSEKIIIADRYVSSNALHQMPKLPHSQWSDYLNWLQDYEHEKLGLPKADTTIILDVPVEVSQKLITKRCEESGESKDIHENALAYLTLCYNAMHFAATEYDWTIIECIKNNQMLSAEKIHEKICEKILGNLRKL